MLRGSFVTFALMSCASAAMAQSVEFQIVERFGDTFVSGADSPPTANASTAGDASDRTLWFVVLARVTGLDPQAFNGLGGFAGSIQMSSGGGNGSYKATGTAGLGGSPTNNSPSNFFPVGTSSNGFATGGAALYEPFRLTANLGAGGNGSRTTTTSSSLVNIVAATGGVSLDRFTPGDLDAAAWGVGAWIPVYTFQYDVLSFNGQALRFTTNFIPTYFTSRTAQGVPNSINFPSTTQGSYTVLPAPGAAALLGLAGVFVSRRRRA